MAVAVVLPNCEWATRAEDALMCAQTQRFTSAAERPNEPGQSRQYTRSREVSVQHLTLEITPHFKQRTIDGTLTLKFKPIASPLQELRLDAVDLQVQNVSASENLQGWQSTDQHIVLTFTQPIPPDRETTITVRYSASPNKGLYFRTAELGYPESDTHLWTQGEPTESRHWFPSLDAPNAKFTTEVICHVPDGMIALSNGKQVSSEIEPGTGLRTFRWIQNKPHANYLVALVAGYLKSVEDTYRDIPLALYTPASQIANAPNTFRATKEMMAFFEKEIGVPYAWDRYSQAAVSGFHWGGMENTTLTVLNEATLHPDGFESLRDSEPLVAHELAHQWFGDLVTCKDWSHLWLNEGFASYYEVLFRESKYGRDELLYEMYQGLRGIVGIPVDKLPIVHRRFTDPNDQFSFRAYGKGAWVLHMLRSQLGPDLYRKCISTYVSRHQFGNVETADLQKVIEELSGKSFDQFFDQYVYHAQQPRLNVLYEWLEREKLAKVTIEQRQEVNEDVLLFRFPVVMRFKGKFGTLDREITVQSKSENFFFPLPEAPEIVRFDPNLTVLAKVDFEVPPPMLHAQLADKTDLIGRFLSIAALKLRSDAETVLKLKQALNEDPFYGIRLEASQALRQINTPEAREALASGQSQPDARVRRQVLSDLVAPYSDASLDRALQSINTEKNPDILQTSLITLGTYPKSKVSELLLRYLNTNSYRAGLASASIQAIRTQDDPSYSEPLLASLKSHVGVWPEFVWGRGAETLGFLSRNAEQKDAVREFLTSYLDHPNRTIQSSVMQALANLADPKAIPAITPFTTLNQNDPAVAPAQAAVKALREAKKPSAEWSDLRDDLSALKKENLELRRELETLKKKFEAWNPTPGTTESTAPASKSKSSSRTSPPALPTRLRN